MDKIVLRRLTQTGSGKVVSLLVPIDRGTFQALLEYAGLFDLDLSQSDLDEYFNVLLPDVLLHPEFGELLHVDVCSENLINVANTVKNRIIAIERNPQPLDV